MKILFRSKQVKETMIPLLGLKISTYLKKENWFFLENLGRLKGKLENSLKTWKKKLSLGKILKKRKRELINPLRNLLFIYAKML